MNKNPIHPIIYVRRYAMRQEEIEETVADPYMGFTSDRAKSVKCGMESEKVLSSRRSFGYKEYDYDEFMTKASIGSHRRHR